MYGRVLLEGKPGLGDFPSKSYVTAETYTQMLSPPRGHLERRGSYSTATPTSQNAALLSLSYSFLQGRLPHPGTCLTCVSELLGN